MYIKSFIPFLRNSQNQINTTIMFYGVLPINKESKPLTIQDLVPRSFKLLTDKGVRSGLTPQEYTFFTVFPT